MILNEQHINDINDNPIKGLQKVFSFAFDQLETHFNPNSWTDKEYEILLETSTFVNVVIQKFDIKIDATIPTNNNDLSHKCTELKEYLEFVSDAVNNYSRLILADSYLSYYSNIFNKTFLYEFSQGDLDRVQTLINELRQCISNNQELESEHIQRLLKRLETLQNELHKKVSDLDRFWGLIGDAGVVIGKLGTDAKPIVERIQELASIAWNTQTKAEELPSTNPNPMLLTNNDLNK